MKRHLDDSDVPAAVNILASLPLELIVQLLKTTHLSIADVFIFCNSGRWSYNLCQNLEVWDEIYTVRFSNIDRRHRVDAIIANNPIGLIFRLDEFKFAASLLFGPPLGIGNMIISDDYDTSAHQLEDLGMINREMVNVINNICGPPDDTPDQLPTWSRDLGVLGTIMHKMIVYGLLEHGFSVDEPTRTLQTECKACPIATRMCDICNVPQCGEECFERHICL